MANEKNLIPLNKRSKEETKNITRNGGIKSGKVRRQKKTFREIAQAMANMQPTDSVIKLVKNILPDYSEKEITIQVAMLARQSDKAMKKGDTRAYESFRDTAEGKPKEYTEVVNTNFNSEIDLSILSIEHLEKLAKMPPEDIEKLVKNL